MNNLPTLADCNEADSAILRSITQHFFTQVGKVSQMPGHRPDLVLTGLLNAFSLAVVSNAQDVTPEQISGFTHDCLEDALRNAHFAIAPPAEPVACELFCWCEKCGYTAKILPEDAHHWEKPGAKYCPDCETKKEEALLTHGAAAPEDRNLTGPLPMWIPEFEP